MLALARFPRNVHLHSWTGTCTLGWWQGKCAQIGTYTFTLALKLAKCNILQAVQNQVVISTLRTVTYSASDVSNWCDRLGVSANKTLCRAK